MPFIHPISNPQVQAVGSFDELVSRRFGDGFNAFYWPRELEGDFGEVVERLAVTEAMEVLHEERLNGLEVGELGRRAIDQMLEDLRRLRDRDLDPVLNCIREYPRDEDNQGIATDVYSFHVDSAPVETDTYLCTYHGAPSSALRNDEAVQRVMVPGTRALLLRLYGGEDDEGFREFLSENCFDLHYEMLPGARTLDFGHGHLWRIAVDYPGSPVLPCIHRAPDASFSDPPRLLLIS